MKRRVHGMNHIGVLPLNLFYVYFSVVFGPGLVIFLIRHAIQKKLAEFFECMLPGSKHGVEIGKNGMSSSKNRSAFFQPHTHTLSRKQPHTLAQRKRENKTAKRTDRQ